MGKKKIIIPVVLIIIAVIFALFAAPFLVKEPSAVLVINKGSVEIFSGEWKPATSGMTLSLNDKIRTLEGAEASVVFYGSSALRLDENTEIMLNELITSQDGNSVSVKQESGRTWSRVMKLSGINDYEVETPTTVATVRGTGFSVEVNEKEDTVKLVDGSLGVASFKIVNGKKEIINELVLEENKSSVTNKKTLDIKEEMLVPDAWISNNLAKDDEFVEEIVDKILAKYSSYIPIIKSQYSVSDDEIRKYLTNYISGSYSEQDIANANLQLPAGMELTL